MLLAGVGVSVSAAATKHPLSPIPAELEDDGAGQRYYEIAYPRPTTRPRATMLVIHGGGWTDTGPPDVHLTIPFANVLAAQGFRAISINFDQSPAIANPEADPDGRPVIDDVLAFYDQIRAAFPDEPVCSFGYSAGAHLSLMLAVERPELDCAIAWAGPSDLESYHRQGQEDYRPGASCDEPMGRGFYLGGVCLVEATWGSDPSVLRWASPALRWPAAAGPRAWIAGADNDPFIPVEQIRYLENAPGVAVNVLRGRDSGPNFVHSPVNPHDKKRMARQWGKWLDEIAPRRSGRAPFPDQDLLSGLHPACDAAVPAGVDWQNSPRPDRHLLLASAGRWAADAPNRFIRATSSCSGSARSQAAGLTLQPITVRPRSEVTMPARAAAWVFAAPAGSFAVRHTASLRGFMSGGEWALGLYASKNPGGGGWRPVAECDATACTGFEMTRDAGGYQFIAAPGTGADPERSRDVAVSSWVLPPETRRIKWELRCARNKGCSLASINPGADPFSTRPTRLRDPAGRPAVLSLYRLEVEVQPQPAKRAR